MDKVFKWLFPTHSLDHPHQQQHKPHLSMTLKLLDPRNLILITLLCNGPSRHSSNNLKSDFVKRVWTRIQSFACLGGEMNILTTHNQGWKQELSSYNLERGQELQPYYQNEAERGSNRDKLLMQFMETTKSTQLALQSVEIQVGELAEAVTQFMFRQEKYFVEVEAQKKSPVKEHESREKDEEKDEEQAQQQ
ncbi:hypothetical protein JHK86_012424 [Glycine max]|nr:hypothetical protein JHK86_012424 [Glycine max]